MAIVTVGIDLTKNVFAVPGVDEVGNRCAIDPGWLLLAKLGALAVPVYL